MQDAVPHPQDGKSSRLAWIILLIVIISFGAFVRFEGLAVRSLWADEFCTWHVSRMPLRDSLTWGPELTKPPLYQFCLRAITSASHPSEYMLRFPAVIAGLLAIPAAYWMGRLASGRAVGCYFALLIASNPFLIQYSREARPYSMLLLGATLSCGLWYSLITSPRRWKYPAYILVTVLCFHAHYLAVMTIAAQIIWLAIYVFMKRSWKPAIPPVTCLGICSILCAPMVIHYLNHRTSMFQGLEWIEPPTFFSVVNVLATITVGFGWIEIILLPCILLWLIAWVYTRNGSRASTFLSRICPGPNDLCPFLLIWLACSWFGLLIVSYLAQPSVVDRYAIAATIPGILLPIVIAHRIHRTLAAFVVVVFLGVSIFGWQKQLDIDPGFREMATYLDSTIQRDRDIVVLVTPEHSDPSWAEAEQLPFEYYPVPGLTVRELQIRANGTPVDESILKDPRVAYLVVTRIDPFPILEAAGRSPELIEMEGKRYTQIGYSVYRLVKVATTPAG